MRTEKLKYLSAPLHFQWKPQSEIDLSAIQRMRECFPKPTLLAPQAWFMSGVEYYGEINIGTYPLNDLVHYLEDTKIGISAFGRLKIWVDWFHYLLPDLILRAANDKTDELYTTIIDYCMVLYRHELYEEYLGFRRDVFSSLMTVIMQKRFWPDDDFVATCWLEPIDEWQPESNGLALEHAMLFCLKFMTVSDIAEWVESIAAIESKKWQEKFSGWLKDFETYEDIWNIPGENIALFRQEIAKYPQFQS